MLQGNLSIFNKVLISLVYFTNIITGKVWVNYL